MTDPLALPLYYKPNGTTKWRLIGNYIKSDSKPYGNNNQNFALLQGEISVINPRNEDDDLVFPVDGDDIACLTNLSGNKILDDAYCGNILRHERVINAWIDPFTSDRRPSLTFVITLQQRDFSKGIFTIPFSTTYNLVYLLDLVFLNYTRDDLGGVLNNGTVIPKYILDAPNVDIASFQFDLGKALDFLTAVTSAAGNYKSGIQYVVEPDSTNTLNIIQQVKIWV